MRSLITTVLIFTLSGCGLISTALDAKRTPVAGNRKNYDQIETVLVDLGWQYKRSASSSDWTFEIWPKQGERIRLSAHAQTNQIAFVCDGAELDDDDRCIAEMNRIYGPAFGVKLTN